MKTNNISKLILGLLCALSINSFAQLNFPRGSQQAKVSQRVGITDVTIMYSRPSVKGREVYGKLVPYGMNNLGFGTAELSPWRAGADENTIIKFSDDVKIEGQPLQAGKYGFHIIVNPDDTATLIFSNNHSSWGSYFYKPEEDALRVDIKTKTIPHTELLTFAFDEVEANAATASLKWERKAFPFKIEVDVPTIVLNDIRSKFSGQAGFQRQNWERAANYALNNGGDLEEALVWIDNAISGQFYSQKTFNNIAIKAQILNKMGKAEAYAQLMDEAAGMANKRQLNTLGYQMLGAKDYERALKYFKLNVANHPTDANAYDSLGECYKTMGDKKNAIKNLKKSLSLNPPANVKANSEKLLAELEAI
ncbi:DUF2911 domain-containing protein [Aestuariivivens sediminicola]|uniref:DUF2911 domain-containing protein n=1 Tax=Aestuariivivens sediminicola TaxID=2913560 RepID=UPI001F59BA0C|nr:DUF2911 domain-containing protein [Aestuariivivens sediminicola]